MKVVVTGSGDSIYDFVISSFFGPATELHMPPFEICFWRDTYRRRRTHSHSPNRCQLIKQESNCHDGASYVISNSHSERRQIKPIHVLTATSADQT
ncbi:hypothetical protein NQ317_012013 [Molorchus minor]|uniref:Uncharacterized protein n=1 Tax=Molorchus minor TaxID=1323400 RepID=A0ABQ9K0G6_9CUCU|nr:hypothetical protein NQ317_012013 [Molorchus minor]